MAQKQAALAQKTKAVSVEMKRLIVQKRLARQYMFDDKINQNGNVWQMVYEDVESAWKGDSSEMRTVEQMTSIFSREQSLFRAHAFKCSQASASGASRDQLDLVDDNKTPTTDLFFAAKMDSRPMAVPPLMMSNDTASDGGVGSKAAFTTPITKKKRKVDEDGAGFSDEEGSDDCALELTSSFAAPGKERQYRAHLGGSRKDKYRPPSGGKGKSEVDPVVHLLEIMREEREHERKQRDLDRQRERDDRQREAELNRAHELAMARIMSGGSA